MTRGSLAIVLILTGCGGKVEPENRASHPHPGASGGGDANAGADASPYAAECEGQQVPPTDLKCTGLYTNVETKTLASRVLHYKPAVPLWADNAEKERWLLLPEGTKIDASDPNEWMFPVGTKVWKEFSLNGKRMETRLFQKTLANHWVPATYEWNDADTVATYSRGRDIPLAGGDYYHVPPPSECNSCHKGRSDRVLGFEQVSLGLPGAEFTTLQDLVDQHLITPEPDRTTLTIGDDGTGMAAAPLGWLHINCGVTCHNGNVNATAYGATMRLRLDPTQLDGSSATAFDAIKTTIGVTVNTPTFLGRQRIVPGDPDTSLIVQLISTRMEAADPTTVQMPPIASHLVDVNDVAMVKEWIAAMKKTSGTETPPPSDNGDTSTSTQGPPPNDLPDHSDAGSKSSGVRDAGGD